MIKILSISLMILSLNFSNHSYASVVSDINLSNFTKEKLKENQLRFTSTKVNFKIHIQSNEFEKLWDEKTLDKDLSEMYRVRKTMYDLMGFSEVKFHEHKLSKISNHQKLTIKGEYKDPEDKLVHFAEVNIYYAKKFLQIKIINEKEKISDSEVEEILKQIPIDNLEV